MHVLGGGFEIFFAVLEGALKLARKLERGHENSMKYLLMSSTPSPAITNDPSLKLFFLLTFCKTLRPLVFENFVII